MDDEDITGFCSDISDQCLQCPVCLDRYVRPKLLPSCGHIVCEECLEGCLSTWSLKCPLCRKDNYLHVWNGVHSLPDSHVTKSLLEMVEKRERRDQNSPEEYLDCEEPETAGNSETSLEEREATTTDIDSISSPSNYTGETSLEEREATTTTTTTEIDSDTTPSNYTCTLCGEVFHDTSELSASWHAATCKIFRHLEGYPTIFVYLMIIVVFFAVVLLSASRTQCRSSRRS